MRISTRGSYAMEAVLAMAILPPDQPVSIREISERTQISDNYLEQIFTLLRTNGIIVSVRGAYGGYLLAKPAEKITVGDVLRATEKAISPVPCVIQPSQCVKSVQCVTRNVWCKLERTISDSIDHIFIADLVLTFGKLESTVESEYSI
jgi:Rrf2 family cysteine metabolism transcriptional repressor